MAGISDWRNWQIGRKTVYKTHEFDGSSHAEGIITEVYKDHLICESEGMYLWIDDDTASMFS